MAIGKKEKNAITVGIIMWVVLMIIAVIIIFKFINIMILKIILMIILPILSFKPFMMIVGYFVKPTTPVPPVSKPDSKQDPIDNIKDYNTRHMTFDNVLLYSQNLIAIHGNEGFLNMILAKGFQFINASEALKGYFGEMLRNLNKIEMAQAVQFCGLSYCCFERFIWHEEKNISQIYSEEQLIAKIQILSHDSLYLKVKIIDPIHIVSPDMNLDILYTASAEPNLMQFISINMISERMMQLIPDKQKIIDIIMIIHSFINLLAGDN